MARRPLLLAGAIVAVMGVAAPSAGEAAVNVWTAAGPLWEARILSLAVDPLSPGTLYAGTSGGGVFKSTDGGLSWAHAGLARLDIHTLVVDPETPSVLWAGASGVNETGTGKGGVFVSADGGASWTARNSGLAPFPEADSGTTADVFALALDPAVPNVVYAGVNQGVLRSADGGRRWATRAVGLPRAEVVSLAIDPGDSEVIYAGVGDGGLYRTRDAGVTWAEVWAAPPGADFRLGVVLDPQEPSTLYAVTRGGTSGGGVFRSADAGLTWVARGVGLPGCPPCPQGGDCPPEPCGTFVSALAIDPFATHILYAATGEGVFKSTDGGARWHPSGTGLPAGGASALALDPVRPSVLYAGVVGEGFLGPRGRGVYKSADAGVSWGARSVGLSTVVIQSLAIEPENPATVYAATDRGLVKTLDAGVTWSAVSDPAPSCVASTLHLGPAPAASRALYAAAGLGSSPCGAFRSADGGETWEHLGLDDLSVSALAVDPTDARTLYAGTAGDGSDVSGMLLKSVDGGKTWTATPADNGQLDPDLRFTAVAVDPVVPESLYAATNLRGVLRSLDGGASWQMSNAGLHPSVNALIVDPFDRLRLHAGTSLVPCCDEPAGGNVYTSRDGAGTWTRSVRGLEAVNVSALVADPLTAGVLYAATTGGVFFSVNGGTGWSPLRRGLPDVAIVSLALDPVAGRTLWAGSRHGGLFKMEIASSFVVDREIAVLLADDLCGDERIDARIERALKRKVGKARALGRKATRAARARRVARLARKADHQLAAIQSQAARGFARGLITRACRDRIQAAVAPRRALLQGLAR
jgi:photosystem II stability/assembly factor-like uncharacterized protein